MQIRLSKPKTPMQLAFENYLNIVSQLYYKATHPLEDVTKDISTQDLFKNPEDEKPIITIDKPKRPGRKAKPKPQVPTMGDSKDKNGKTEAAGTPSEEGKVVAPEETKNQGENMVFVTNDVLDSLVSPLRSDYVFGKSLNI
jgi:hypothetical protein